MSFQKIHEKFTKTDNQPNSFRSINDIKVRKVCHDSQKKFVRVFFNEHSFVDKITILRYADVDWDFSDQVVESKNLFGSEDIYSNKLMSPEEKLLQERQRKKTSGVTDYHLNTDFSSITVLAYGKVFCAAKVFDCETSFSLLNFKMPLTKISMCPSECGLFAFVSGANIYVINPDSEYRKMITQHDESTKDVIFSGMPPFIIQEEFDRYTGLWWSPVDRLDSKIIHLLYETVDQSNVENVALFATGYEPDAEKFRYPKPGRPNAKSKLNLAQLMIENEYKIENIEYLTWDHTKITNGEDLEYLVRAGWTNDGQYVWVQFLNRLQTTISIYLVPISAFTKDGFNDSDTPVVLILQESVDPDSWIEVTNYFEVISLDVSDRAECKIRFLYASTLDDGENKGENLVGYVYQTSWACEKTHDSVRGKWRREFNVSPHGSNLCNDSTFFYCARDDIVYYNIYNDHAIIMSVFACDLKKKEKYRLTMAQSGIMVQRFSYKLLNWSPDDDVFVIESSSIVESPAIEVFRLKEKDRQKIKRIGLITDKVKIDEALNKNFNILQYPKHLEMAGTKFQGLYFEPFCDDLKVNGKYPTIHYVYGGPGFNMVRGLYMKNTLEFIQMFCHYGFAVFICDTIGCSNRGMAETKKLKYNFGKIELESHVQFLNHLANQVTTVDLDRVGVIGASYGGYFSLHAACRLCPKVYKYCVAASPVVDWSYYDSGYTERYMGLPDTNKDAYFKSSVLAYVHGLPTDKTRLMICHGGRDENVHFYHTSRFILDLDKQLKPYHFQFYPTSRHSFKERNHFIASSIYFFLSNFQSDMPTQKID